MKLGKLTYKQNTALWRFMTYYYQTFNIEDLDKSEGGILFPFYKGYSLDNLDKVRQFAVPFDNPHYDSIMECIDIEKEGNILFIKKVKELPEWITNGDYHKITFRLNYVDIDKLDELAKRYED